MSIVLTVPGLGGSGPNHWQAQWEEQYPQCRRIKAIDWNIPDKANWLNSLDTCIRACEEPPLLAAHSLGCALVAHWAVHASPDLVKGAIFVAPSDVDDQKSVPAEAMCFSPMPMKVLPFPTAIITSNNDIYITPNRAQTFATAWGADFLNIGDRGHINADTHLSNWQEGWDILQNLAVPNQSIESLEA